MKRKRDDANMDGVGPGPRTPGRGDAAVPIKSEYGGSVRSIYIKQTALVTQPNSSDGNRASCLDPGRQTKGSCLDPGQQTKGSSRDAKSGQPICGAEVSPGVICQETRDTAVLRQGVYECRKCATMFASRLLVTAGGGYDEGAWHITDLHGQVIPSSAGTVSILGDKSEWLGSMQSEEQQNATSDPWDDAWKDDESASSTETLVEWTGLLGDTDTVDTTVPDDVADMMEVPNAQHYKGSKADVGIESTFADHVAALELPPVVVTTCVDMWHTLRTKYGFQRIAAAAGLEAAILELASLRCGQPRLRSKLVAQTGSSERSISLAIQRLDKVRIKSVPRGLSGPRSSDQEVIRSAVTKNGFPVDYFHAPAAFGLAQLFLSSWAGVKLACMRKQDGKKRPEYILLDETRTWCERFYKDPSRSLLQRAAQAIGLQGVANIRDRLPAPPPSSSSDGKGARMMEDDDTPLDDMKQLHTMANRNRESYDLAAAATCILAATITTSVNKVVLPDSSQTRTYFLVSQLGMHQLSETFVCKEMDLSVKLIGACLKQLQLTNPTLADYQRIHHRKPMSLFATTAKRVSDGA